MILNKGGREFGEPFTLPALPGVPYALALADLNLDRQLDVVVGCIKAPGVIYFNGENGRTFERVPWNDGKGAVYAMVFADVNGDKWPDIIAARSDAPNAIWFATPRE